MWTELRLWDLWTKQDKIWNSIQEKRVALADCFTLFGVRAVPHAASISDRSPVCLAVATAKVERTLPAGHRHDRFVVYLK